MPAGDYQWQLALQEGRYRNEFGHFRAWMTPSGYIRFQYSEDGYYDWTPEEGDEACFDGTFGMLNSLPEFQRNLEVWARRRYWRSPEDYEALQAEYHAGVSELRDQYERAYNQWEDDRANYVTQIQRLQARAEAAEAAQVSLSVLHEQVAD